MTGAAGHPGAVRAFLDESHLALCERAWRLAARDIASLPSPEDDDGARRQAREILGLLGREGWLDPIERFDLRACVIAREALAHASPLADAVFALQALGTTPLLLAAGGGAAESGEGGRGGAADGGEGSGPGAPAGGGDGAAARALCDRWLPAVLAGEAMAAFAMTEPEAGSDVAAMRTTARREGDDYVLDGTKTLISNAGIADFYTVFARTAADGDGAEGVSGNRRGGHRGISCFVVPADAPGFRFVRPLVMSAPHPLGEIAFEGCRVPASHRLGPEGAGFKLGLATLDRLRPTVAAAACGMARRALDEALAHATTRHQFGAPLSDLQLVQVKLARMATELDAARLLVYRAAWEKDRGADRITVEAAMAKAYATEAAQRVVDDAVQILGGRGVLADSPVDRLYRSVRALRIYEGTTEVQHLIIARHLVADAVAAAEVAAGAKGATSDVGATGDGDATGDGGETGDGGATGDGDATGDGGATGASGGDGAASDGTFTDTDTGAGGATGSGTPP